MGGDDDVCGGGGTRKVVVEVTRGDFEEVERCCGETAAAEGAPAALSPFVEK